MGESGIDTGALSKGFLANLIQEIGHKFFPLGVPIDSMLHVVNRFLKCYGESAAVSIAQGGPTPNFLHEKMYDLLTNKEQTGDPFTKSDEEIFAALLENFTEHAEMILDHGYSGIIESSKSEEMVETVKVSITNRRSLYTNEFCNGLELYGIADAMMTNRTIMKPLFVKQSNETSIDANYVLPIRVPIYSEIGTRKRSVEEMIIDTFQDLLSRWTVLPVTQKLLPQKKMVLRSLQRCLQKEC